MKKLIILTLSLVQFASCEKNLSTPANSSPAPVITAQGNDLKGGGDTVGGGSTIKKRPLESYAKKLEKVDAYKLKVVPLIEKLKMELPRMAADFIHLSNNRVWYFIPASLDKIKSAVIGTYSPEVDQTAVQDLNAVWFDSNLFDEMEKEDQARLIIHELVMGMHLLEYKPRLDRCFAKAALNLFTVSEKSAAIYSDEIQNCKNNYLIGIDQTSHKFTLTNDDYDVIRKIVIELTSDEPNWKQIKQIVEDNKLRSYND